MDSDGWGEVSVFSLGQIKSATNNIGTFDGSDSDIRYSLADPDTVPAVDIEKRAREKVKLAEAMQSSTDDSVKYSLDDFSTQVDRVLDNTYDKNNHVYTMAVSEAQAKADKRYNKKAHYHALGADLIKDLPQALNRPVMIIKSNTSDTGIDFVVLTDLLVYNSDTKQQEVVIVAIKPSGQGFYYNIEFSANIALSGYGKKDILNYVNTAKNENRILYAYKKYNQQKQNTPGVQFPDSILSADYNNSLSQYKRIVNSYYMQKSKENTDDIRYSLAGPDTVPAVDLEKRAREKVKLAEAMQSSTDDGVKYSLESSAYSYDTLTRKKDMWVTKLSDDIPTNEDGEIDR